MPGFNDLLTTVSENAVALATAIAAAENQASGVAEMTQTAELDLLTSIAETSRYVAPSDKDGRGKLRKVVYDEIGEERGKKYFTIAGNFAQKEWFHLATQDAMLDYIASHGVESLAGVVRLSEQSPESGGTQRGQERAAKRAERAADRQAEKDRFESLALHEKAWEVLGELCGDERASVIGKLARMVEAEEATEAAA